MSDLTLDATGVPSSFTIIVHELLAYAPDGLVFTNDLTHENLLANISRATVSLGWHDACDASWLACLNAEPRNRCPFTKQHVSKEELTILTVTNIERYRHRLILP